MRTYKAVSWRALVLLCSFFLLATIQPKVSADLARETEVLLQMKAIWKNPRELSGWRNDTSTCEWPYVTCDLDTNTTITELNINLIPLNAGIPAIVGDLTNLTFLGFYSCDVIGEIPPAIGSLKKLTVLMLSSNGLTGSIPAELGALTSLESLRLGQNNLTGTLPDLSGLQSLKSLYIGPNNYLSGPLPSWLGNLHQLEELSLFITNLTGSIPPEIGNLTNLSSINMQSSSLSGLLPAELGNLISLTRMQMDGNKFIGSIPDSFRNLRNLTSLVLGSNRLNGSLSSWFENLQSLEEIDLDKNLFDGPIPPVFGNMLKLTKIVLSNNQLSGEIPDTLGNLTNLTRLSLQNNFLVGTVPDSILRLPNLAMLQLDNNCLNGKSPTNETSAIPSDYSYAGNCFNDSSLSQACKCVATTPSPDTTLGVTEGGNSNNNTKIYIAVGVVVGTLLVLGILILIFFRSGRPHQKEVPHKGAVKCYKLSEIKEATKNLTTKIGSGGQATVYKAEFKGDQYKGGIQVVAVKRFGHEIEHRRKNRAEKTFDQEVGLLARLNHRCLVNVTGYCVESGEYMLLVDYMDNGSLHDHLHGIRSKNSFLTWEERSNILKCVALGIEYLHYGCSPPVYHRDIKTANILLSSEQQAIAKVADFGLSKLTSIEFNDDEIDYNTGAPKAEATQVQGSHGYIDPEFRKTCIYSEKSDIYSFGVVLLELITARKAFEKKTDTILTEWIRPYLAEPRGVLQVVDPKLKDRFAEDELIAVAELARECIEPLPGNRPTIREILETLRNIFRKEPTMITPSQQKSIPSTRELSGVQSNFSESINSYGRSDVLPRD